MNIDGGGSGPMDFEGGCVLASERSSLLCFMCGLGSVNIKLTANLVFSELNHKWSFYFFRSLPLEF